MKMLRNTYPVTCISCLGGQRQRVAIAIHSACDPALIIADEPTALDPRNQKGAISVLKLCSCCRGITRYTFITHDLRLARELATKIAVMKDGRFVGGC